MKRPQDWPSRLTVFLTEKRNQPFSWGSNDCCLFASDWISIITGKDHAADLRGTYDSALSAARVLSELGGVLGIASAVAEREGWKEITAPFARRGDIVAEDAGHGPTLGVCAGAMSAFPGEHGLLFRPTSLCLKSWRVE